MIKRISVLSLIFLLAFSTVTFAAPGNIVVNRDLQKPTNSEDVIQRYAEDETVRVTVEIEGEAPIETATKKGVKFGDLSVAEKKKLLNEAKAKKQAAKQAMKEKKINAKFLQEFEAVVNGFSAEVKYSDIEEIKQLPNVKNVVISTFYEKPIAEPDMASSKELVEAQHAWNEYGYKGEGMVIGVIDSGVDHNHQDFVLSEGTEKALSEAEVNRIIAEEELPGRYYTEKVPYGYNYFDQNHEYTDFNNSSNAHGMHVAGTVGANGDEANGGVKGIAPEAQILNLKVFSNNPAYGGTYSDIYVAAIDDAIKLGADVLNMSLGAPAGFVEHDAPDQLAVSRAVENGIMMVISAGNSNIYGDGYFYPYTSNPDYGVVGSPGVSYDSLQVASFENSHLSIDELEYAIDGGDRVAAGFMSASTVAPEVGTSVELVEAGLGFPEDFEGKDFAGKYALIQRGELDFVTKTLNAQAAGAAGAIIYNNTDGMVNMASDPAIQIPQLSLSKVDGDALREALLAGQTATVTFTGGKTAIPNETAGKMSAFTSWGLTPNLDFKPEISAPGGMIYSTINNGGYSVKSGTSMAAPHVAGGSSLVLNRVDDEFGLEGRDRVELAKKLLMNTASPVELEGAPVSPRRQGAGLMKLHAALSTPVVVTDSRTDEAKVALKEIKGNTVTFTLKATNFSDEAVSYEVSASALSDVPVNAGGFYVNLPNDFGSLPLDGVATVNGQAVNTITVPANGSTTFEVTLDVSAWDAALNSYYENGYWLDGFVTLVDPSDNHPTLVVPYAGFKGNWDQAPIFDLPLWDPMTFYGYTGLWTDLNGVDLRSYGETGIFSPNGDGASDLIVPIISFLRNALQTTVSVLDENGNVLEELYTYNYVRKDYYDSGDGSAYKILDGWDGTVNGQVVSDGLYYIKLDAVIDWDNARVNSIQFPVVVDNTAPTVEADINRGKREVSLAVSDNVGVAQWEVYVNGERTTEEPIVDEFEVELTGIHPSSVVKVIVTDYAGNVTEDVVMGPQGNAHGKLKGNNNNK